MHTALRAILCIISAMSLAGAAATLNNPSFETGGSAPDGWTLSGKGTWGSGGAFDGTRFLTIQNDGVSREDAYWKSAPITFQPDTVYEMRICFRYRPDILFATGTMVLGTAFATRDVLLQSQESKPVWETFTMRFVTPSVIDAESAFRLGQWNLKGAIDFDALELYPVSIAHRKTGDVTLGDGERISGTQYSFTAPLGTLGGISRPLQSFQGKLHHNRWRFHQPGDYVIYRHAIEGCTQKRAGVRIVSMFHAETTWRMIIEASADGTGYRQIGTVEKKSGPTASFDVPSAMLPAKEIWIRLRNDTADSSTPVFFQCNGYEYTAELDGTVPEAAGASTFITVLGSDDAVAVRPNTVAAGARAFAVDVKNKGVKTLAVTPSLTVKNPNGTARVYQAVLQTIPSGAVTSIRIPFNAPEAGKHTMEFLLDRTLQTRLSAELNVPVLDVSAFGELLSSPDPDIGVWWASSGWKVSRTRPLPDTKGAAVKIRTARNETEAAQIVISPKQELRGLTAAAGDLTGPDGAKIPAGAVEVLRVRYVRVDKASDMLGVTGYWPDPLPAFSGGITIPAGENQPLWIRVKAPKSAKPGIYTGAVRITAERFSASVPVAVEVYDFALPDRMTCESAFGFRHGSAVKYHDLKNESDRRAVIGKYLQSFSDHHISPYDPAPFDAFKVQWPKTGTAWEGGRIVPEAHAGKGALYLEDSSDTQNAVCRYQESIPLSERPLIFSAWYRTGDADKDAYAYIGFYDAAGAFIPNRNAGIKIPASIDWKKIESKVGGIPDGAVSARLWFHSVPYHAKGEGKGRVWLDDISLRGGTVVAELLNGGDCENGASLGKDPKVTFDWTAWDSAMNRAINDYHFNTFKFSIPGLGGGTFYARTEGELLGFRENTPEYKTLLSAWCTAAREHLTAKGWLSNAYIYPFDEPAEKDYPFVINQTRTIKENFPGLRRMVPLNLGTTDALNGAFDVWCPILSSHNPVFKAAREKEGSRFWWYICTGPRAPYIASFIDRPATDLRVWLWQTWQEGIDGILIWETLYWHSDAAYPEALQNPYEDTMSWNSGYGTAKGEKRPWAAGDGRFLYPPERAMGKGGPVLDGPVDSIRWEMLRDGIEDYEYHVLLKKALAAKRGKLSASDIGRYEALLSVPNTITAGITVYTTDPAPIEARRHELAKAIETLSR